MNGTQPFPSGEYRLRDGGKFSADSLTDRVSIISFLSCAGDDTGQESVLQALY